MIGTLAIVVVIVWFQLPMAFFRWWKEYFPGRDFIGFVLALFILFLPIEILMILGG